MLNKARDGKTLLSLLDQSEKVLKEKISIYNKVIDDDSSANKIPEDDRRDILVAIGEANLLLRGKLKQFRDLCNQNLVCIDFFIFLNAKQRLYHLSISYENS
ncbi:unnamed protein product [Didymodactylos carnosus]|uniref:Uncharacterized protein n=1 Tax=Didymodactylos carnosus TaxID=1234261 RepID=A0A8S2FNZ2_9BILA|nr:unnamed protein product [Didymodactylos carnosus]CAF4312172.1 unnamed protein product [Didymodactylos carnosus]